MHMIALFNRRRATLNVFFYVSVAIPQKRQSTDIYTQPYAHIQAHIQANIRVHTSTYYHTYKHTYKQPYAKMVGKGRSFPFCRKDRTAEECNSVNGLETVSYTCVLF